MSLDWDTTKCPAGPITPSTPDDEAAWLQTLVFTTMSVDLNEVDTGEFLWRVRYLETIGRHITNEPIPLAMLKRWTGTRVNVAPTTRTAFVRRYDKILAREVTQAVARELAARSGTP